MEWFSLDLEPSVRGRLEQLLAAPAQDLWRRGGHRFRSDMAQAGFDIGRPSAELHTARTAVEAKNLEHLERAIEILHLGSLIIDDIQDNSKVRRNGPAVHQVVGISQAIAIGNWLYFRALRELDRMKVSAEISLKIIRLFHKGIEAAHHGQALDIGTTIDAIPGAELASIAGIIARFKSGSLTTLAIAGGAVLAEADDKFVASAEEFGYEFGKLLQALNDLGNLCGSFDASRRFEDLLSGRVSFVWEVVHAKFGDVGVAQLRAAASASSEQVAAWLETRPLKAEGRLRVAHAYSRSKQQFETTANIGASRLQVFDEIFNRIESAYD